MRSTHLVAKRMTSGRCGADSHKGQAASQNDLLPWIRTSASIISDLREERHEQEQSAPQDRSPRLQLQHRDRPDDAVASISRQARSLDQNTAPTAPVQTLATSF